MNKKLTTTALLALIFTMPFSASAISVGWDRYVSGVGGGIRGLYNSGTDHVLIGGIATTTSAQLEVKGTGLQVTSTSTQSNIGILAGRYDPNFYAGSDIGAKANSAYAGANSIGLNLTVPPPAAGGQWSYNTPIVAGTSGKPMRIECPFGGSAGNYATNGVGLLYTGTTGSAIKLDTGQGSNESGSASGVVNCVIQGTNGTTARTSIGIEFGGATNGAFTGYTNGVNISGMGTGIKFSGNTSFNYIQNSTINFNGTNISEPDTGGANCENLRILGSIIADANWQSGGGFPTDYKGMYVQESGNCQWNNIANSFDDSQVFQDQFGGTANVWSWVANHFENPNQHTYSMLETIPTAVNVVNNFIGGDMMNDVVGGQPDQIKAAGKVHLIGFTSDANSNVTVPVTRIVNALASSTVVTWTGLSCMGANRTSFVYGNIPCSPFGVGSDYGPPSLYVSSSTAQHKTGNVGIATSSPDSTAILNIGLNSLTSASSTIRMKKLQFEGENSAGAMTCVYFVGTTLTAQAGACNN